MSQSGLDRLFRPASLALVGGTEPARVVAQLDLLGYQGEIWPIHPTRAEIGGRRCSRAVGDLLETPDAAFVAVSRDSVIPVVRDLAAIGTGCAVIYSSGFGEAGQSQLQADLVAAAGAMRIVGPNTYGYVNALDGTALWPDVHGLERIDRGVAIVTQSGNIGINLTMARRALDMGIVVTVGNQADVGIVDLVDWFLSDDRITGIGLQLESLGDPGEFGKVALRAAELSIPIVALKMGHSSRGAVVTATHTGAMAGEREVYSAFFDHYGIAQADSIPSFMETLKIAGRVKANPRLLSLSSSGGEAAHVADVADSLQVELPDLTPDVISAATDTVDPLVTVSNPMDYHTLDWGDYDALATTFSALCRGPFDVAMLVIDFPRGEIPGEWWAACEAFTAGLGGLPGLVVASLPENMPEEAQVRITGMGLIPMLGIVETISALAALRPPPAWGLARPARRVAGQQLLDEVASKALLASVGVQIPDGEVTDDPVSSTIAFPITVKTIGVGHKSEVGGVVVGVADQSALLEALAGMPESSRYLIEETVSGGLGEYLVDLRSTDLGWLLTVGRGGVDVERYRSRIHRMLPTDVVALAAQVAGDDTLIPEVVARLEELIDSDASILEIEINPLLLRSEDAVALDAMVVVS